MCVFVYRKWARRGMVLWYARIVVDVMRVRMCMWMCMCADVRVWSVQAGHFVCFMFGGPVACGLTLCEALW